jgi:superfamily II DNA or RNA helicase
VSYADFLTRKRQTSEADGIRDIDLPAAMFPHQVDVARWAGERGRAAAFLDTGLGKTRIQLAWADAMRGNGAALVICPLSIAAQTAREAAAIGIEATVVRRQEQVTGPGIWITNYEMSHAFDPAMFGAVVLDESSILKNHEGRTRGALIERWGKVRYRLACTATPAPNDHTELANHAEFLGAMTRVEMLAAFFVHDDDGWRMKGHAADAMYAWMARWAVAARRPSDITGNTNDDLDYVLPDLRIHGHVIEVNQAPEGQLFATSIGGVGGRARIRKATIDERVAKAVQLLGHDRPAIAWAGLNDEADRVARALPDAVNLHGSMDPDEKVEAIEAFVAGSVRVLVTKPSIAGFGLNFQHAADQVFVGLGDSYESYYQAIRRSWRFGQTRPVDVHVVVSDLEAEIVANVRAKERSANDITDRLVAALNSNREVHA